MIRYLLPSSTPFLARAILLVLLCAAAGIGGYRAIRYHHLHDHLITWLAGKHVRSSLWNQEKNRNGSLWLPDFHLAASREIPQIAQNLSGLSYADDKNLLIGVINRPAALVTLHPDGRYKNRYPLHGISDVEGVAYLGAGQIALSSEKHGYITLAQLPEIPGPIALDKAPRLALDAGEDDNSGIEGLGYDPILDQLYAVKEHSPRGLFRIDGICASRNSCSLGNARITDISHWLKNAGFARDLSSVEFDAAHRRVVLLSEQSQTLLEFDLSGRPISTQRIGGRPGDPHMPQAEGLALSPDGAMYLASEPNLLYRFAATGAEDE